MKFSTISIFFAISTAPFTSATLRGGASRSLENTEPAIEDSSQLASAQFLLSCSTDADCPGTIDICEDGQCVVSEGIGAFGGDHNILGSAEVSISGKNNFDCTMVCEMWSKEGREQTLPPAFSMQGTHLRMDFAEMGAEINTLICSRSHKKCDLGADATLIPGPNADTEAWVEKRENDEIVFHTVEGATINI